MEQHPAILEAYIAASTEVPRFVGIEALVSVASGRRQDDVGMLAIIEAPAVVMFEIGSKLRASPIAGSALRVPIPEAPDVGSSSRVAVVQGFMKSSWEFMCARKRLFLEPFVESNLQDSEVASAMMTWRFAGIEGT